MRRQVCLGICVLSVALTAGCDTDQPMVVDEHLAEVEFLSSGAQTTKYYTWIVSDVTAGGGGPAEETLWCELVTGSQATGVPFSVPWQYALQISVIPAGQTEAVAITSEEAFAPDFNRAPYDPDENAHGQSTPSDFFVTHPRGACSGDLTLICNPNSSSSYCQDRNAGGCVPRMNCSGAYATLCTDDADCVGFGTCVGEIQRTFDFNSATRRTLTSASRELLQANGNVIYDTCVGDAACVAQVEAVVGAMDPSLGFCPGSDLGDPAIDPATDDLTSGDPTIFGFALDKGDTVIVEARLSQFPPGSVEFLQQPGLRARFYMDGALLSEDAVIGSTTSPGGTTGADAAVRFSFTPR